MLERITPNEMRSVFTPTKLGDPKPMTYKAVVCLYCHETFPARLVGDRQANVCLTCKHNQNRKAMKSSMPKKYWDCSWDNYKNSPFNYEARTAAAEWVDGGGKSNLFLHGASGSGKTYLAMTAIMELGEPVRVIRVPEMLLSFQSAVKEHDEQTMIKEFTTGRVILFDDVGAHRMSDFTIEMFGIILDRMEWECRGGLIFTSNLSPKQIYETMGERVSSRLVGIATPIHLGGADLRLIKTKDKGTKNEEAVIRVAVVSDDQYQGN